MKIPATILIAFSLLFSVSLADDTPKPITKDIARKAIEVFRADPLSKLGEGAASVILKFAEESPDVKVEIGMKVLPWFKSTPPVPHSQQLLGAFIAGNARSQLDSGNAGNDSYAGVLQVIATCRQIQKAEPGFKVPEVEKLIELSTRNKLKEYLEKP